MIGLDTNVLLRYIVRDDAAQAQAATQVIETRCSRETPGYVAQVVLAEIAWVLTRGYRYPRESVHDVLAALLASEDLEFQDAATARVALDRFRTGTADFADCLIGAVHAAAGCAETVTFDRQAGKLPTHLVIR